MPTRLSSLGNSAWICNTVELHAELIPCTSFDKGAQRAWVHEPFLLLTLFRDDWHFAPHMKARIFRLMLHKAFKSCDEKLRSLGSWWAGHSPFCLPPKDMSTWQKILRLAPASQMSNTWISASEERAEQFLEHSNKLIMSEQNHTLEESAWTCGYIHIQEMVQQWRSNEALPTLISFLLSSSIHSYICYYKEYLYIYKEKKGL